MKKRILSMICALALCLGLLPTAAFALDGDKTIMLGTNGISGYDDSTNSYDYIYFGNWEAPDQYTDSGPIKWRVLDDLTNTEEPGLFLLTDRAFGEGKYGGGVYFKQNGSSNAWQDSDAQKWCQDFYDNSFSTGEQGAVLATTKSDAAYKASSGNRPLPYGVSQLEADKVFFLSAEEAESSAYGFIDDDARKAYFGNTQYYGAWWLRSPVEQKGKPNAGTIHRTHGYLYGMTVSNSGYTARPAFNLDLDAVLFTSAADGGKSASGMASGLTAVDAYDGSEWKLTLLDDSRDFDVTETEVSCKSGDTITLTYSGASTGANEYISALLTDQQDNVLYYGRIAQATTEAAADGEISLAIPDALADGTYTLNVFSEQCNDDYKTDYASAFEAISLTVDETAPALSDDRATRDSETTATVKFTSDEAGTYYYEVVDSGAATPTIGTTEEGTACISGENTISLNSLTGTVPMDMYIVAKDAVGNVSDALKITIPEYIAPVYDISADPQLLDFGTVTEGYEAPAEQTVTITNAGNQPQTLTQPASTSSFEVGTLSKAELPVGETVTFTVRPKAGLPVGSYSENIVVSGLGNTTVSVTANFTVKQFSSGGGSSSSGGSSTTTETTKNPDGSTTTTVTKPDGTTTETTKFPDGSKEVI